MQAKKVLIVTDSLGLPRPKPDFLKDQECWPYRVSKIAGDFEFYFHMRSGYSTDDLVADLKEVLGSYEPDLIFLQIGIVDCAPRALTKKELAFISRLPIFNKILHTLIKKYRENIILWRQITYVDELRFEQNLEKFKAHFRQAKIAFVPIAPASEGYQANSPGVENNILKYNNILCRLCEEVPAFINSESLNIFLPDGYHLNSSGHELVYESVKTRLMTELDQKIS